MARRRSKGEGSIYWSERKGLWVAKITLPTGERRSKSSKSQKVVREWLHTSQSALRTGLLAGNDSVTVSEFFSNYMKTVAEHTLRPKTLEGYRSVLKINILPIIGKMKLSQLRPDHLQSLYSSRLEKGLSRRTVQLIHLFIHRVLSQAVQWGVLTRNVSDFVKPPSPEKKPMTVWSISEVKQFLEGTKDNRFFVLYVLAIYGGFREVELLGIRREECRGETVTVNQAVQYQIGKGVVIAHPKTDRSRRSVKLPKFAADVLNGYIEQMDENQRLLFVTQSGEPINPRFLIKKFKEKIKELGLCDIRFHDLRHTSATLLLSANVHPKVVQEGLGHQSIVLTLDTYSHVIPSMQVEAADKLGKLLD